MRNLSTRDCECNKSCKIDEHLDIKSCSYEKRLTSKILNTTETSFHDKNVTCEKLIILFTQFHKWSYVFYY